MVWAAGLAVAGVPGNPFPARVINLSLGGQSACGATYQNAINAILTAGAVIAIAAGNANHDASLDSPGNCNGVITVAATGRSGQRASYSNYGTLVELAAPGGSDGQYVLSTLNLGTTSPNLTQGGWTYVQYGGTSMATPHVAGVAALMLARNPSLTPAQVLSIMQSSARAFPSGTIRDCRSTGPLVAGSQLCGAGILDAGAAVAAVPLPKRRDRVFDSNGYADLLWYSAASGSEVWLMNGLAPGATGLLRATPWVVAATGDFDGDGRTDIAWYNSVTGAAEATLMNGVTPGPDGALFASLATQIVNTGDFNGDGKRDLLVRNAATGALQVFLMNGNTPGSTPTLFTDLNRVPSGVGDFNGDGKSDIVLRNTATGATEIVLLSGGAILTSAVIRADPNWVVHRVGDFDGDGRSDILWRHAITGALAVWLMNDFAPTRGAAFPVDPDWSVLLTGDYNGDGKADLVLRNDANGQTVIWLMNGAAPVSSGVIRTSTSFAPIP
jgi:serine protease